MTMQERLVLTLDSKQIREACELYVDRRITGDEIARAEVSPDWHVIVRVSKKRVRVSKTKQTA